MSQPITEKLIPERSPDAKFRTLVVLLDGTGDSEDDDVTNIVLLKNMLHGSREENDKQMVLYLSGIGSGPKAHEAIFEDEKKKGPQSVLRKVTEQAIANTFHEYVIRSYRWLAHNYKEGDKICIFGFSRGAYTARVLAGMINGVGLLPKAKADAPGVEAAYDLYDNFADLPSPPVNETVREAAWLALQATWEEFKVEKQSQEALIEFLGCWDTVNSVGFGRAIRLGFTRTNDIVRTFRHAIALDEHRGKFKQNNWSGPPQEVPDVADRPHKKQPRVKTDVEEVWFAGCHCDVGGGSVKNNTRPNLAHIPLRWMIRQCFKKNSNLIFKEAKIREFDIEPSTIYPTIQAPSEAEERQDALDALARKYDMLLTYKWKIAEWVPLQFDRKTADGNWVPVSESNSSNGRTIPPLQVQHGGKIKVHKTVKLRMESKIEEEGSLKGKPYVPLARVGYEPQFEDKTPFKKAVEKGWVEWVA